MGQREVLTVHAFSVLSCYPTVLVHTRTTSFKDLILLNMLFESEIDENVTAKSTQIALMLQ